jgi:heptosyltransferase-2
MISFATGARVRSIHFHGHNDRNRYSTVTVPGKGILKPIIERDMDAVRALGIHAPAGRLPHIYLQDSEKNDAKDSLSRLGLSSPLQPSRLMMIGLGASRPTKRWPVDRFASLAVEWAVKKQGSALAVAGPDEMAEAQAFLKAVDDHLMLAVPDTAQRAIVRARITADHRLPLRKLAALISQASVFVGNDSGPRHIAVALETPSVTLFGPEHPFEWHPYPTERHPYLFIDGLACRRDALPGYPAWCGIEPCEVEQHQCMRLIGVDQVFAECERVSK